MKHFKTTIYSIQSEKVEGHVKVAFLSDLHGAQYGEANGELVCALYEQQVDAVLIGGDMMVVKTYAEENLQPLEQVLAALDGQIPVYYALGNHEQRMHTDRVTFPGYWDHFWSLMKKYHVKMAVNHTFRLPGGIFVSGLWTPRVCYDKFVPRMRKPGWVSERLPRMKEPGYHVLLAHAPGYMKDYWEAGADLALSGHYHGGVMRLPKNRGLVSPQFVPLAKYSWGKVTCPEDDSKVGIISAGLGTHSVNVRLFNPPELVIIEWNG